MTASALLSKGIFPIAPTPFLENGDLDLDGMRRVLDCMIDQGVDAICILANYSEQFLLTDAERDQLTDLCLTHIAGRVPVIVTTSHFSTRIASERARKAAQAGAAMLMLMPPYQSAAMERELPAADFRFANAKQLWVVGQDSLFLWDIDTKKLKRLTLTPDAEKATIGPLALLGTDGIKEAYATGKGRIVVRAKIHTEQAAGGRARIVVCEQNTR